MEEFGEEYKALEPQPERSHMEPQQNLPMALGAKGIAPQNINDLMTLATVMVKGGIYKGTPVEASCVIGMGLELGLSPFQAIQVIKSINGKFSVFGDGIPALLHASGKLKGMREYNEGDGDNFTAVCELHRHGLDAPVVGRFSVGQAKQAALWGKAGPWQQYPERMLQMRARGFAARDGFADVLRGVITAEEAQDYPKSAVLASKPLPGTVPVDPLAEIAAETAKIMGGTVLSIDPMPGAPKQAKTSPVASQGPSSRFVESLRSGPTIPQAIKKAMGEDPPLTTDQCLAQIKDYADAMSEGNPEIKQRLVQSWSSFVGKDGMTVSGWKDISNPPKSDRWIATTRHRAKEEFEKWLAEREHRSAAQAPQAPDSAGVTVDNIPF